MSNGKSAVLSDRIISHIQERGSQVFSKDSNGCLNISKATNEELSSELSQFDTIAKELKLPTKNHAENTGTWNALNEKSKTLVEKITTAQKSSAPDSETTKNNLCVLIKHIDSLQFSHTSQESKKIVLAYLTTVVPRIVDYENNLIQKKINLANKTKEQYQVLAFFFMASLIIHVGANVIQPMTLPLMIISCLSFGSVPAFFVYDIFYNDKHEKIDDILKLEMSKNAKKELVKTLE